MVGGRGTKKAPPTWRGQKLVAGAGFEPAIPRCGIMSLTSVANRLQDRIRDRPSASSDGFRVCGHHSAAANCSPKPTTRVHGIESTEIRQYYVGGDERKRFHLSRCKTYLWRF